MALATKRVHATLSISDQVAMQIVRLASHIEHWVNMDNVSSIVITYQLKLFPTFQLLPYPSSGMTIKIKNKMHCVRTQDTRCVGVWVWFLSDGVTL